MVKKHLSLSTIIIIISMCLIGSISYMFYKSPYVLRVVDTDEEKGMIMLQELESKLTLADRIDTAKNSCAIRDFSMQTGYKFQDEDGNKRTSEQEAECKALETIDVYQHKDNHYYFTQEK